MKVLIDTPIWSLALRRKTNNPSAKETQLTTDLANLIDEGRAQLIGPVRQELLSGIRDATQYERLKEHLGAFPDEPINTGDFEFAAQLSNQCRSAGVAGSAVDFLICSVSLRRKWPIFTTDEDFPAFAAVLPLERYRPRK